MRWLILILFLTTVPFVWWRAHRSKKGEESYIRSGKTWSAVATYTAIWVAIAYLLNWLGWYDQPLPFSIPSWIIEDLVALVTSKSFILIPLSIAFIYVLIWQNRLKDDNGNKLPLKVRLLAVVVVIILGTAVLWLFNSSR